MPTTAQTWTAASRLWWRSWRKRRVLSRRAGSSPPPAAHSSRRLEARAVRCGALPCGGPAARPVTQRSSAVTTSPPRSTLRWQAWSSSGRRKKAKRRWSTRSLPPSRPYRKTLPAADSCATTATGDPLAALDAVAAELARGADRFRAAGLEDEADILETNKLMVEDPGLRLEVERLVAGLGPAESLRQATARHAELLAALADPLLAARATDVRQLGVRAVRALAGTTLPAPTEGSILVARDLGPADVADLRLEEGLVLGIALAEGAATSHAAIMARAFGVPMTVGLGDDLLSIGAGETVIVEGDDGSVVVDPSAARLFDAEGKVSRRPHL